MEDSGIFDHSKFYEKVVYVISGLCAFSLLLMAKPIYSTFSNLPSLFVISLAALIQIKSVFVFFKANKGKTPWKLSYGEAIALALLAYLTIYIFGFISIFPNSNISVFKQISHIVFFVNGNLDFPNEVSDNIEYIYIIMSVASVFVPTVYIAMIFTIGTRLHKGVN